MLKVINILLVIVFLTCMSIPVNAEMRSYSGLVISEVKVRYDSTVPSDQNEFIELHNDSAEAILLSDIELRYFNSTVPSEDTVPQTQIIDAGYLEPDARIVFIKDVSKIPNSLPIEFSSLADSGGRLQLVKESIIVDELAWTSTQSVASPSSSPPILFQCTTSSISCTSNKVLSFDKSYDSLLGYTSSSWVLGEPNPESSLTTVPITDEEPVIEDDSNSEPIPANPDCEAILITEILPNPEGSDTEGEFIELYNPTDHAIIMNDCSLQTSSNSKIYSLDSVEIQPGVYVAFYGARTALTLPNTAGGSVWLIANDVELQSVQYPASLEDNQSWILSELGWVTTYTATPDQPNQIVSVKPCADGQIRNEATGRCQKQAVAVSTVFSACEPGQTRNPVTNRCRAETTSNGLMPCSIGQERSLETNRCRTVNTAVAALVPCKEGQERNATTNRCRNIVQDTVLSACPNGQERSMETNRCRKISVSVPQTLAAVTDLETPASEFGPEWWIAGSITTLALGYALYEWRYDIKSFVRQVQTKL